MPTDLERYQQSAGKFDPDQAMDTFRRSHMVSGTLLAVAAHVLLVGVFSIGTLRSWLAPPPDDGEVVQADPNAPATQPSTQPLATTQPARADGAETDNTETGTGNRLDTIKDTEIGRELTTKQAPPDNPFGEGFDLP